MPLPFADEILGCPRPSDRTRSPGESTLRFFSRAGWSLDSDRDSVPALLGEIVLLQHRARALEAELHRQEESEVAPGRAPDAPFASLFVAGSPEVFVSASPEPRTVAGCRILVVDDNDDAAEVLAESLELMGHTAQVAGDGPGAIAAAAEFEPELVLLDLSLPGMDGFEVALRLRQQSTAAPLRVVAVTGYSPADARSRSEARSFDAHLTKPVDFRQLQTVIDRLLSPPGRGEACGWQQSDPDPAPQAGGVG